MKNYAEMSDFEINKAVHLVLLKKGKIKEQFRISPSDFVDVFRNSFGEPSVIAVMRYVKNGLSDGYNPFGGAFDYCNNPLDAWPIIVKNNIAIEPEATAFIDKPTGNWIATDFNIHFQHKDKNPLRSVMVVFLMMKEKEQETK